MMENSMDIKSVMNRLLHQESITVLEANYFISEMCSVENKVPNAQELQGIMQLIQSGMFQIHTPILKYCMLKNYDYYSLVDKQGNMIACWIK